jgi:hypothetical protein
MREKIFIRTLCCLFVAIMACGTAFAQHGKIASGPYKGPMVPMASPEAPDAAPFYSNLVVDTCTGCNYSGANGYLLLGPNNCGLPGSTQWLAYPFIAGHTGTTRQAIMSITNWGICTPTSLQFTVAIYDDNCTGSPATQISNSVVVTAPAAPCLLARARNLSASLTQGQTYWLVATTTVDDTQNGTTAVWWEANSGLFSVNFNDGNGWQAATAASPGGFSVQ